LIYRGKMAGEVEIEANYTPPKVTWNEDDRSTANPSPIESANATPKISLKNNPLGNLSNEAASAIMNIVNNSKKRGTLTQQGAIDIMKILQSPAAQARFLGKAVDPPNNPTPKNEKILG
jgi:hypothetical protein